MLCEKEALLLNMLDWSKLKACADDEINKAEILKFVFQRVENIVRKGGNASYRHSLLFSQCFQKASVLGVINPLPHNKILDQTKLKAFADYKLNITKMIISVFDRVENVGKGEIACTSNLLFPKSLQKASFPDMSKGVKVREWVKSQNCVVKS